MGWGTWVCFHASYKSRSLCEQLLLQDPMASLLESLDPLVLMEQVLELKQIKHGS